MFKIGEFSQLGQISTRMLRHYDKLGLLQPSSIDEWTGYRYYTIDQLPRLHRIIALKDLGLSLSQIADLLAADGDLPVAQLRGMLTLKQAEVRREITEGQMRLQRIEARLNQIEQAGQPSPYEIVIKSVSPLPVASVTAVVPHIEEMDYYCESLTREIYKALRKAGIRPLQPEMILYHAAEYKETDVDVEAAVAVLPRHVDHQPLGDTVRFRELPGHELAASLIYEGVLRDIVPAVLELLGWVAYQEHVPAGPLREIHLSGPLHSGDVEDEEAVTEILLPIKPANMPGQRGPL
jgi:DNA-binding transcriptional MerR regulator/effector-binding domain-containing protein